MIPQKVILFCGSAGGLSVFYDYIKPWEMDTQVSIVALFHRSSEANDYLTQIIANHSKMPVEIANHSSKMEGGKVYVALGGYHLLLEEDYTFKLDVSDKVHFCRPSADVSLESFSYVLGEKLIGIIVSGANKDGAKGCQSVVQRKGKVIIQNPKDALFDQMPKAAVAILGNQAILVSSNKLYEASKKLLV